MKKLLITLMLVSPFSFADWGDVYYCEMTSYSLTTMKGERTDHRLRKFKFKLDETKNAMVFGKSGPFKSHPILKLEKGSDSLTPSKDLWLANSKIGTLFFKQGKLLYSYMPIMNGTMISADCDKF
jgi:hypothetical protein